MRFTFCRADCSAPFDVAVTESWFHHPPPHFFLLCTVVVVHESPPFPLSIRFRWHLPADSESAYPFRHIPSLLLVPFDRTILSKSQSYSSILFSLIALRLG